MPTMPLRKPFEKLRRSVAEAAPGIVLHAASNLASEIADAAPRDSGRLAASVEAVPGVDSPGVAEASVEITGGHDPQHMVGAVEFGRHGQAPNPFIRRTFLANRNAAAADIASGVARKLRP